MDDHGSPYEHDFPDNCWGGNADISFVSAVNSSCTASLLIVWHGLNVILREGSYFEVWAETASQLSVQAHLAVWRESDISTTSQDMPLQSFLHWQVFFKILGTDECKTHCS